MGADLELLAAFLVDMRRAVDGKALNARRQRNGPADARTGALGRVHDLAGGLVEHAMIERLEADADILAFHRTLPVCFRLSRFRPQAMMEATTPAPTVRPPSRMAKRSPSSMAIGAISSTSIVTLSPGITISVPCGRITCPVTSVVRKENFGRELGKNGVGRPPSPLGRVDDA